MVIVCTLPVFLNISLERLIPLRVCLTLPEEVLVKKMGHGAYHAFSSSQTQVPRYALSVVLMMMIFMV